MTEPSATANSPCGCEPAKPDADPTSGENVENEESHDSDENSESVAPGSPTWSVVSLSELVVVRSGSPSSHVRAVSPALAVANGEPRVSPPPGSSVVSSLGAPGAVARVWREHTPGSRNESCDSEDELLANDSNDGLACDSDDGLTDASGDGRWSDDLSDPESPDYIHDPATRFLVRIKASNARHLKDYGHLWQPIPAPAARAAPSRDANDFRKDATPSPTRETALANEVTASETAHALLTCFRKGAAKQLRLLANFVHDETTISFDGCSDDDDDAFSMLARLLKQWWTHCTALTCALALRVVRAVIALHRMAFQSPTNTNATDAKDEADKPLSPEDTPVISQLISFLTRSPKETRKKNDSGASNQKRASLTDYVVTGVIFTAPLVTAAVVWVVALRRTV